MESVPLGMQIKDVYGSAHKVLEYSFLLNASTTLFSYTSLLGKEARKILAREGLIFKGAKQLNLSLITN